MHEPLATDFSNLQRHQHFILIKMQRGVRDIYLGLHLILICVVEFRV